MTRHSNHSKVQQPVINQSRQLTVDFVLDHLKNKSAPDEVLELLSSVVSFIFVRGKYIQDFSGLSLEDTVGYRWIEFQEKLITIHFENSEVEYDWSIQKYVHKFKTTNVTYDGFAWKVNTDCRTQVEG